MKKQALQFDELPEVAGRYIDRVIKKMGYRRKVRREVRQELADHFIDALRGCRDEADRQALVSQLIESFGDAKLLAKLIRRGKKRCRPLWIKTILRGFQAIGVSIVLLIAYAFLFITAKPTISIDYLARWNEMARPTVAQTENAWPYYEKAVGLYVEPAPAIAEIINMKDGEHLKRFSQLTPQEQTAIRIWLDENSPVWDTLNDQQQRAIEQCLAYNLVCDITTATRGPDPLYSELNEFVIYLRNKILYPESDPYIPLRHQEPKDVELKDLPHDILSKWKQEQTVPANFEKAVEVATVREWISRTGNEEQFVFADFDESQFALFKEWLAKNEPAWREFVAGSQKKYCWRKYDYGNNDPQEQWLIAILLTNLSELRSIARLGVWQARLAAEEGNPAEAMNDCLAMVRTGKHLQRQNTTVIEQLVGLAISNLGHNQIIQLAEHTTLSAAELARMQKELRNIYGPAYPTMDITGERLFLLDTIQHCFTEGGIGGGHIVPKNVMSLGSDNDADEDFLRTLMGCGFIIHARRDETQAKAMELYDRMADKMRFSPYEKRVEGVDFGEWIRILPRYRYGLIYMMMPAFDRAGELAFRGKAEHEATLTVLALRRWRLDKGRYPDSLDELLQQGYLKQLPADPYSDGPLKYQRRDDDFILYSFGEDFDDGGGVQSPENPWGRDDLNKDKQDQRYQGGDRVFWPVAADR